MVEQSSGGDEWRIDDLARLSGTTVDTIRFYQREGLLPPAQRRGRLLLYGREHLEHLERIRDLQARHFSLKAIRSLSDEGRLQMLDRLFKPAELTYDRDQLAAHSGLDHEFLDELEAAGLLGEPSLHGALAYDSDDLAVLVAVRESLERGMPKAVVLVLARAIREQMDDLERQMYEIFSVGGVGLGSELTDEELDAFRTVAGNDIDSFLVDSSTLLQYVHRRGIQRLVVQAMASGELAPRS